jgi:hypothetical protein
MRSWTLDVLAALHSLGKREFTLDEAYSPAPGLSALHPANRHVGPKIRQQLQVLPLRFADSLRVNILVRC